ncbi:NAD(+) diphosphatase [Agromyces sp. S2-1-8]|uniref:NAD(+) diphosphatase n=1 Tax=Agromyces sp. S2-1-8 TaxID=2897180 RepID=UPI001E638F30|nr:NAD(+) diphosphatase [Agromyces sp. S2-1-8]MCD5346686.1 NAD(+) diphosphatase [Agromyces sp. S2-1-8]
MTEHDPLPPFARAVIDRDAGRRTAPGFESSFDADPASRVLFVHGDRVLLAEQVDGSAPALELRRPSAAPAGDLRIYLGRDPRFAYEARVVDDDTAAALEPEAARWQGLRAVATAVDALDAGLFVEALALANWHAAHGFCPRCGSTTTPGQAGWVRRCDRDDALLFPRTDPAVIMLVTDDHDRLLLGSNALWEQRRFSLLAGFVEPGESLEEAVVREIAEEAGIAVDRVEYRASQPWPFPASLMLGFAARVAPGADPATATPDGEEILELRWFTRDELADAWGGVLLPGATSIARWLIEQWYGGPVETAPQEPDRAPAVAERSGT